jgi:hypothetical protein
MALLDLQGMETTSSGHGVNSNVSLTLCNDNSDVSLILCT